MWRFILLRFLPRRILPLLALYELYRVFRRFERPSVERPRRMVVSGDPSPSDEAALTPAAPKDRADVTSMTPDESDGQLYGG